MLNDENTFYTSQVPLPPPSGFHVRSVDSNFGLALTGIVAASIIYICTLALLLLFVTMLRNSTSVQQFGDLLCSLLGVVAVFLLIVFFYVVLAVTPLALASLTLCLLIARSLYPDIRWSIVGGFGGGLTGYVGTCIVLTRPEPTDWMWLVSVALGPVLATLLGQAGGCWAALAPWVLRYSAPDEQSASNPWQFDIRQLLIATAWVAVILAALKGLGALGVGSASVLFGGLVFQICSLPLVIGVVKRFRSRHSYAAA